jgi:hypothetical protein
MATKNTRNAGLYLCNTLGGTYVLVSKTHGFNPSLTTDFSEDTSHGDQFKSYIPGLSDFKAKLTAWYQTTNSTLMAMALNRISEYFMAYPDKADTLNYIRGQCYLGMDGLDMDLGKTVEESYTMVLANADVAIIKAGVAL